MTEKLHVHWKPGTLDTLLVTSATGTLEWLAREFEGTFGRSAMAAMYLRGSVIVEREIQSVTAVVHSAA